MSNSTIKDTSERPSSVPSLGGTHLYTRSVVLDGEDGHRSSRSVLFGTGRLVARNLQLGFDGVTLQSGVSGALLRILFLRGHRGRSRFWYRAWPGDSVSLSQQNLREWAQSGGHERPPGK